MLVAKPNVTIIKTNNVGIESNYDLKLEKPFPGKCAFTTPIEKGFIEMATSRRFFPVIKAFDLLGWRPTVNLEEGMRRTTRWIKEEIYTD